VAKTGGPGRPKIPNVSKRMKSGMFGRERNGIQQISKVGSDRAEGERVGGEDVEWRFIETIFKTCSP